MPMGIEGSPSLPENADPAFWQLSLMAGTIGAPFFILSASAPMLQRWFVYTGHKDAHNPYFLYGASNLGSMAGLLLYPVLIEPLWTLYDQLSYWRIGFGLTVISIALCALISFGLKTRNNKPLEQKNTTGDPITLAARLNWVYLAFIPSAMMLVVTTYVTTDIAAVPLLWVVPLALYLSTFIIAFARKQIISIERVTKYLGVFVLLMLLAEIFSAHYIIILPYITMVLHLSVFFLVSLLCHLMLYGKRPSAENLTGFYFFLSLGGAMGGVFSAIIVPTIFIIPLEYALIMTLALLVRFSEEQNTSDTINKLRGINLKESINADIFLFAIISIVLAGVLVLSDDTTKIYGFFAVLFAIITLFLLKNRWLLALVVMPVFMSQITLIDRNAIYFDRNFFGFMNVSDEGNLRYFRHGKIIHGSQFLDQDLKTTVTAYYAKNSPMYEALVSLNKEGHDNIAVLGLGTGSLACLTAPNRHFDFYEIDQDVIDIADKKGYFTYLKDCGSDYDIILGDARLKIKEKPNQNYDVIVLDVFTSDSIPIHLLTLDAVQIYLDKLKPEGTLVFHVSNRYLDLEPVLAEVSEFLSIPARAKFGLSHMIEGTKTRSRESHLVVFTKNENHITALEERGWGALKTRQGVDVWTDKYSNIMSVLYPFTSDLRRKEHFQKVKSPSDNAKTKE